jgi:putative oxidoreductase
MGTYIADFQTFSIGILVARVIIGLLMAAHGAQKMFGWFGGYGLSATGKGFEQIGFHPGTAFAGAASISEILSGLLVTLGFLGPVGPALMISVMIVAAITVHWENGIIAKNGIELTLLYATAALGLAVTGFGQYSLDALLGIAGHLPAVDTWIALALGVVGAFANVALRRRPAIAVVRT